MIYLLLNSILNSFTIIVLLSISPLQVYLFYIFRYSNVGCINIYKCYIFFLDRTFYDYIITLSTLVEVFDLKSVLSNISIAIPDLFWFPFAWNTIFHFFTFNWCVSLKLKWVSFRNHIDRSWFYTYSDTWSLLIGEFHLYI